MKYFIPIVKVPKNNIKVRFYRVRVDPRPVGSREYEQREMCERILRKYIRQSGLTAFPSSPFLGVIEGEPRDSEVVVDDHSYKIKVLKEEQKNISDSDYDEAIRSILRSKLDTFDGTYVTNMEKRDMLIIVEGFNIQTYQDHQNAYLAIHRRVILEIDRDLEWFIEKIGREKVLGKRVKTRSSYLFARESGVISEIILPNERNYWYLWREVKDHYRSEGGKKWGWFKKQKTRIPIIRVRCQKKRRSKELKFLASALTLQTHPDNFEILKKVKPEAISELERRIYSSRRELYDFLKCSIDKILRNSQSLGLNPELVAMKETAGLLKPWEYKFIEPPTFMFGNNQKSESPLSGLKRFGPVDVSGRDFGSLYIVTSYEDIGYEAENELDSFLYELAGTLRRMFRLNVKYELRSLNIDSAVKKAKDALANYDRAIILQILTEEDDRPDSLYAEIRRKAFKEGIPVQTILTEKLKNYKSATVNNVAVAIYAKTGGKPWVLSEPVSSMFKSAIYIGYDISKRHGGTRAGTAIVYDNHGQFISHVNRDLPTMGDSDIVPALHMKAFIKDIVEETAKKIKRIELVVIHKDGEIREEELTGIKEAVKNLGRKLNVLVLSFPKTGPFLFKVDRQKADDPEEGFLIYAGEQLVDGTPRRTYLLQSRLPLGRGAKPVRLLKYRIVFVGYSDGGTLKDKALNARLEEDIGRQVFYLGKLNWATMKGVSKAPITVHFAHKASEILSYGIEKINVSDHHLYML